MAIVNTTNVGIGKELSKDCSLPVPTVSNTNSDECGLPFRMTRKSIPTTLLLLIEQVLTGGVDEGRFVGLFHDVNSKKKEAHHGP